MNEWPKKLRFAEKSLWAWNHFAWFVCQIHQLYIWQKKVKQTLPKITYKTTSHFLSSAYHAKNACFILSTLKEKLNHPMFKIHPKLLNSQKFYKLGLRKYLLKSFRYKNNSSTSHWLHTNLQWSSDFLRWPLRNLEKISHFFWTRYLCKVK